MISHGLLNLILPACFFYLQTGVPNMIPLVHALEFIVGLNPFLGGPCAVIKLMYRGKYAISNPNDKSTDIFSQNSVMYLCLGMITCIIFAPLLIIRNETYNLRSENDGVLAQIDRDPNLKMQIDEMKEDVENSRMDNDVAEEAQKVKSMIEANEAHKMTVCVSELRKTFILPQEEEKEENAFADAEVKNARTKKKVLQAVRGTSFRVDKHESFILLGVNGAGKSTTFKCLSIDEVISSGDIRIKGMPIKELYQSPEKMRNQIGYCPQKDVIRKGLTVKESIVCLAAMKGIEPEKLEIFAELYAKKFELFHFFNTNVENLSGGNKRKFSTLQAMIGNPSLIMLDESSAGVDPYSRRKLWKTIREQSSKSALIVTTHSMEEAEALGTKLAIMVDGQFKCFGRAQHIKDKFGSGFTITMKLDLGQVVLRKAKQITGNLNPRLGTDSHSEANVNKTAEDNASLLGTQIQAINKKLTTLEGVQNQIDNWLEADNGNEELKESEHEDGFVKPRQVIKFKNELTEKGLLSVFYKKLKAGQPVDADALFRTVLYLNEISAIITQFEVEFNSASQLIDFTGN